jgi:transposase
MSKRVFYVGMDVHKETVELSVFKGMSEQAELEKKMKHDLTTLKKFFMQLQSKGTVICCYEAGSCGFVLKRYLDTETDVLCKVIAPGSIPKRVSDRIKTDRRDARNLAKLLRSEQLTEVYVPSSHDEAVREYIRSRGGVKQDIRKEKQRLLQFLLRNGYTYETNRYWTKKHRQWMNTLEFSFPILQSVFDQMYAKLTYLEEQLAEMDARIKEIALSEYYKERVAKLRCLKGVDYLTALALVSEVGDFQRFESAGSFMAYLGMVPREYSSGNRIQRGAITKTGNSRLRLLLVESAWHYAKTKGSGIRVVERRKDQDLHVVAYAEKCEKRLRRKYTRMISRNKIKQVAITATARELAGFVWGLMNDAVA